jgi:hypothetical protein
MQYSATILYHQQSSARRPVTEQVAAQIPGPKEPWVSEVLVPIFAAAVAHLATKSGYPHETRSAILISVPDKWLPWLLQLPIADCSHVSTKLQHDFGDDIGSHIWNDTEGTVRRVWKQWQERRNHTNANPAHHLGEEEMLRLKLQLAFAAKGVTTSRHDLAVSALIGPSLVSCSQGLARHYAP